METILVQAPQIAGVKLSLAKQTTRQAALADALDAFSSNTLIDAAVFDGSAAADRKMILERMRCFKPFVVISSDKTLQPSDFSALPGVFLWFNNDQLHFARQDLSLLNSCFKFAEPNVMRQSVDALMSMAFWLALFRARNLQRLNRASLYWQRDLSLKLRVHTLPDYISKMNGGLAIGEVLRRKLSISKFEYGFNDPRIYPDDRGDRKTDNNGLGEVLSAIGEFPGIAEHTNEIMLTPHIFVTRSDPLSTDEGIQRAISGDKRSFVIVINASDFEIKDYERTERVLCLDDDDLRLSRQDLAQRIKDFLRVFVFTFDTNYTDSNDTLNRENARLVRNRVRANLIGAETPQRALLPDGLFDATLAGEATAVQLSSKLRVDEVGVYPVVAPSVVSGVEILRTTTKRLVVLPKISIPRSSSIPEWSLLGAKTVPETDGEQHKNPCIEVKFRQMDPFFDFRTLDALEEEDVAERRKRVSQAVQDNNAILEKTLSDGIFQTYRELQHADGSMLFRHYQYTLPMVRDTSLQSLLAPQISAIRSALNDGSGRGLFRVLSSGSFHEERAGAWAVGAVLSQLLSGGIGSVGLPIWDSAPGVSEVGLSDSGNPTAVAQKVIELGTAPTEGGSTNDAARFIDSFAHPIERHLRLQELLGERRSPSINPRIAVFVSALASTLLVSKNDQPPIH